MNHRAATLTLAALLAGCDAPAPADSDDESTWIDVGDARFAEDGESSVIAVPAQAPLAALALRVTTEPGVCFQLSELVDGAGHTAIDGRPPGPFCRDCALRTAVAVSSGLFVLPQRPDLAPDAGLALRVAQVRCDTLTPLTAPDDPPALRVEIQPIAELPPRAALDLRFLVADSSILAGDDARQQALVASLADELASSGITPRLVDTIALPDLPTDLRFHTGDPAALAAALADVPPDETTVDVVFGGCLEFDDPFFGPPTAVDGYTPQIPGGAGPADAVFLPGLDCFAPSLGPVDPPARTQARVLAHELGHYLGLYHAVEADGVTDALADTDADNIMNFRPTLATATGFSPEQGRVMRAHPRVRPLPE